VDLLEPSLDYHAWTGSKPAFHSLDETPAGVLSPV